jgi:hypothetical protein
VVKALGEYITDTNDAVRVKGELDRETTRKSIPSLTGHHPPRLGVSLLTNVIKSAPPNRINRQASE